MAFLIAFWGLGMDVPVMGAPPDPNALASQIDKHLATGWQEAKVTPADTVDDAAFARRAYLDLIGRIPTVAEVRKFLNDRSSDKRAKLVSQLLDTAAHAQHMASFWRREWIPQADVPESTLGEQIESWLAGRLQDRVPYDRIVRDLLTVSAVRRKADTPPTTFLVASDFKPENLAANTSRAFLGINLDCAQCHNHPFARWTREQFWETAAFFVRPAEQKETSRLSILIPNTKTTVTPRVLAGSEPKWPTELSADTGRRVLAEWVTARDNPYFARNAVNRVWANLVGTGLVEPLDDLSSENAASHPKLLDELAKAFADSGFDLKYLTTAIVLSKAYQLSSVIPSRGSSDPRLFAAAAVRGLSGEQLYDSLRVASGLSAERTDLDPTIAQRARKRFAEKFRIERAGTAQRSILQALSLMNGATTAELTDIAKTPTLRSVADAPFLDAKGKVEALYLATFSRKPSADELAPLVKYVEKGGPEGDAKKALADVFWALLNSSEFGTNH